MLNKFITQYFGLALQDRSAGTEILKTLKFLRQSQKWTREELIDYQLAKTRALIQFLSENNSSFKNKTEYLSFEAFGWNDFARLPLFTKKELRLEDTTTTGFDKKKNKAAKTGGTTGPPVKVYKNTTSRSFAWAGYYRWYEWMGLHYSDRSVTFWGSRTVLSTGKLALITGRVKGWLTNNYTINSFEINDTTAPQILKALSRQKPAIVKGYLSALLQVADYANSQGLAHRPKAISSTTETVLKPYREYLEQTFGCQLFDQYGCTEVTGVAFECSEHKGLHINMEHVLVEVVDENNQPVFEEPGRILLTDLDNTTMPFVRYEVGDVGVLSKETCTCGSKSYLLKSIEGRVADIITLNNGSKVHGVFFTDILYEIDEQGYGSRISRFQARQKKDGHLVFAIESKEDINEAYLTSLKKALGKFFNSFEISIETELPTEASGKFRYVISANS